MDSVCSVLSPVYPRASPPGDSYKPEVSQTALVKLSEPQNKQNDMNMGKGACREEGRLMEWEGGRRGVGSNILRMHHVWNGQRTNLMNFIQKINLGVWFRICRVNYDTEIWLLPSLPFEWGKEDFLLLISSKPHQPTLTMIKWTIFYWMFSIMLYLSVLTACMSVHGVCAVPTGTRKVIQCPRIGGAGNDCERPCAGN